MKPSKKTSKTENSAKSNESAVVPETGHDTSSQADVIGGQSTTGGATTAPLSLTWPTGNALLDLAGSEGLLLLVLDASGAPTGSVDSATGVFTPGVPAALQTGDWDPETRLLPYPPARVLASLARLPRDHRVAVVVPRQRLAAWTAAAAGRQASFVRRGTTWQLR